MLLVQGSNETDFFDSRPTLMNWVWNYYKRIMDEFEFFFNYIFNFINILDSSKCFLFLKMKT